MYKIIKVEDTVRVPPKRFGEDLKKAIAGEIENTLAGRIDKNLGVILAVTADLFPDISRFRKMFAGLGQILTASPEEDATVL